MLRCDRRAGFGLAVALGLCLLASASRADPQATSDLLLGVAGTGDAVSWSRTRFYGALRGDVTFGAAEPSAVRIGPALELGTAGFSDLRLVPGATVEIPLDEILALSLTPGVFVRTADGTAFGLSSRAFFGIRPYNRVGSYALSGGLVAGFDRDLGSSPRSAVVIAAEVDAMALVLPVLLLAEWIRGPRD